MLVALAILYAETFVARVTQSAILFRVLMDFAAFAIVFVGLRFWMARKELSGTRTILLLALLLLGFFAVLLLFPGFVSRHQGFGDSLIRVASSKGAEAVPAFVAVGFVIYALVCWLRREH